MLRNGLRAGVSVGVLLAMLLPRHGAASLDLGYRGWGISIGNAKRVTGVRINGVDRHVERVNGLNLTLWNPHKNPRAAFNGAPPSASSGRKPDTCTAWPSAAWAPQPASASGVWQPGASASAPRS